MHLPIEAPESARATATGLFTQFRANAATNDGCGCATVVGVEPAPHNKIAGLAATSSATAVLAWGVCCVLPLALPAVMVSTFRGVFAAFANAYLVVRGVINHRVPKAIGRRTGAGVCLSTWSLTVTR